MTDGVLKQDLNAQKIKNSTIYLDKNHNTHIFQVIPLFKYKPALKQHLNSIPWTTVTA